ncbi:Sel1 repeat protein [Senna tora]|uniref:Sel1 repeat protein n=1 Tax=Senna tora TaxID=362788 RepID=A0A834TZF5_9FABA|nr:Sel1 repeat protein [Senna tora]
MGKSLQSAAMLQKLSRVLNSSAKAHKPKQTQAKSPNSVASPPCGAIKLQSQPQPSLNSQSRIPLARVVADCTKRWFRDALDEAKDGDVSMQVIVGQMYNSGYGVRRDPNEGRAWIRQASISRRSSVWKASIKKPGYGASDSDSDEVENKAR